MTTTHRIGTSRVEVSGSPEEVARLHRLARELRLTDQILTFDVDQVNIVAMGPAPAWTTLDGTTVEFNAAQMPAPTGAYDIAVWLGTNAHEIGHVLFSPRGGSPLMGRISVARPVVKRAHNILEDQRQERLLLGRFAAWRGYLIAALAHHIDPAADGAWVLLAGRTWLPAADRLAARSAFAGDSAEVERIVGTYQRLADPGRTDSAMAWALVNDLAKIMDQDRVEPQGYSCQPMTGGEPEEDDPLDSTLPATADESTEQGDAIDSPGSSDAKSDADDDDSTEESGSDLSDSTGGSDAGSQSSEPKAGTKSSLRDAAAEAIAADAADDLDRVVDAIDSPAVADDSTADRHPGNYVEASDHARRLEIEVSDALLDMKDEREAGWIKRTDSGRLNVRRWATDPTVDFDTVFDRFDPGALDATDMEVVLLVDTSGSMQGQVESLAEAVWAIRTAVDRLEGAVTVFTYDTQVRLLNLSHERVDGRMFVPNADGGTDPTSALYEAHRIVAGSQARNRLVLMLTDGWWAGIGDFREALAAINATGAVTALAILGGGGADPDYGQQVTRRIDAPGDLALFFRSVAERLIEEAS